LAHDHDPRVRRADSRHRVHTSAAEGAEPAVVYGPAQARQVGEGQQTAASITRARRSEPIALNKVRMLVAVLSPSACVVTAWSAVATPISIEAAAARAARGSAPVSLGHDPIAVGDALGFLQDGLARQVHTSLPVDLGDLAIYLIANLDGILDALDPVLGELADMDQPVLVGHDLDNGHEVHDPDHLALVVLANFDFTRQVADYLLGLRRRLTVDRADDHPPVVFDVDRGHTGVLDDLADHLAAGADHLADLVGMDLDGDHARCVLRHDGPRLRDGGVHLVHDEQPSLPRLLDRGGQHLDAYSLDLHVHLHGRDAGTCARHLEVHVAQRVLDSLDVTEHGDFSVLCLYQAHGNAGHLSLDRDAG